MTTRRYWCILNKTNVALCKEPRMKVFWNPECRAVIAADGLFAIFSIVPPQVDPLWWAEGVLKQTIIPHVPHAFTRLLPKPAIMELEDTLPAQPNHSDPNQRHQRPEPGANAQHTIPPGS